MTKREERLVTDPVIAKLQESLASQGLDPKNPAHDDAIREAIGHVLEHATPSELGTLIAAAPGEPFGSFSAWGDDHYEISSGAELLKAAAWTVLAVAISPEEPRSDKT